MDAKDDGGGGDNWSYKTYANSQIVTTNKPSKTQLFTGQMPFLLPNQNSVGALENLMKF